MHVSPAERAGLRGGFAGLVLVCLLSALAWSGLREPAKRVPQNRAATSSAAATIGTLIPPIAKDRVHSKPPVLSRSVADSWRGLETGDPLVREEAFDRTTRTVSRPGSRAPPSPTV
jgi:hypothetical protein